MLADIPPPLPALSAHSGYIQVDTAAACTLWHLQACPPPHHHLYTHPDGVLHTPPSPMHVNVESRAFIYNNNNHANLYWFRKKNPLGGYLQILYTCDNRDWRYTSAPHFTLTSRILCPSRTYILGKQKKTCPLPYECEIDNSRSGLPLEMSISFSHFEHKDTITLTCRARVCVHEHG